MNFLEVHAVITILIMSATTVAHSGENWNLVLMYKSTANLSCEDEHFSPGDHTDAYYQWLLPSGEILDENSGASNDHYSLEANGSNLHIYDIDKPDFGIYYCLVVLGQHFHIHSAVKRGVNVDGPYYGNMMEKYSLNIRYGLLAGLAVCIFMSLLCYNHDQFQSRHDKPANRVPTNDGIKSLPFQLHFPKTVQSAYDNNAFEREMQEVNEDNKLSRGRLHGNSLDKEGDSQTRV